VGAQIANHLAHSLALRAGASDREEPLLVAQLAAPPAGGATDGPASLLGAASLTARARLPAWNLDLGLHARCGLFQADGQVVAQVNPPGGAPARAARAAEDVAESEQVTEDILEVREDGGGEIWRPARGAADGRVAVAVVHGALLRVGQHAVGLGDFLEFLLSLFLAFGVTVGMVLHGEATVGALDLLVGGFAPDS
jgi:hypothetical protein